MTPPDGSAQQPGTGDGTPQTKPECLKEFKPEDQRFVEALGKFVATYDPAHVAKRFRIGLSREMFGDTCCWAIDPVTGDVVCVPCDDAFAFVRGKRR